MSMTELQIDQIRRQCEDVFLQIARLTDHGPQNAIAQLFTDDGELDRDGTVFRGRAALLDLYAKRAASLMTRHLVSNVTVSPLSNEQAVCHAYATVYRFRTADGSSPVPPVTCEGPESVVEYEDQMVKTDDGWKVRRRVMKTVIQLKK